MSEEGGGASRSTDPTDVSLREYLGSRMEALDRHLSAELSALRRETHAANENSQRAIEVAAHEAAERLAAHNGLIDQMKERDAGKATREALGSHKDDTDKRFGRIERFQAALMGGLFLLSLIGIANLVKVWTG